MISGAGRRLDVKTRCNWHSEHLESSDDSGEWFELLPSWAIHLEAELSV